MRMEYQTLCFGVDAGTLDGRCLECAANLKAFVGFATVHETCRTDNDPVRVEYSEGRHRTYLSHG